MERSSGSKEDGNAIAENVSVKIKIRTGVKPKEVIVLDDDAIPRATHKAKRVVDLRAAIDPHIN